MRKAFIFVAVFALSVGCRELSHSEGVSLESLKAASQRFSWFILLEGAEGEPVRYLYTDSRQHVHLYRLKKGKPVLEWETTNLGSRASALFVTDLDKDDKEEIVIATVGGRILIYGATEYELLWENLQDPFDKIDCMVSANIDRDPQEELIFIADAFLYIYDGANKTLEWQSQRNFTAGEMVIGNVDSDAQPEIILNTGKVIDSRFYTVEFESRERFGERISLLDINGDDIPEIIGENTDFTLRVFDIYAERELW